MRREQQQQRQQQQIQPQQQTGMPIAVAQAVAMPVAMASMQIDVPYDAVPGQTIQLLVQGQMMAIVLPPNARPGGSITVQVPSGTIPTATVEVVQTAQPVGNSSSAIVMGVAL